MYCMKCGREMANDAKFCGYCGSPRECEAMPQPTLRNEYVFRFSEETIKKQKRATAIGLTGIIAILLIPVLLLTAGRGMGETLPALLGLILIPLLIGVPIGLGLKSGMYKRLRETELILNGNMISRVSKKTREDIYLSRISKIRYQRDNRGKILILKIKTDEDTRIITGFENMDGVLGTLGEMLPDKSIISEKEGIDASRPGIQILGLIVGAVLGFLIFISSDSSRSYVILALLVYAFAMIFPIFGPFARGFGTRMKKYDILMFLILMIAFAVLLLAAFMSRV